MESNDEFNIITLKYHNKEKLINNKEVTIKNFMC